MSDEACRKAFDREMETQQKSQSELDEGWKYGHRAHAWRLAYFAGQAASEQRIAKLREKLKSISEMDDDYSIDDAKDEAREALARDEEPKWEEFDTTGKWNPDSQPQGKFRRIKLDGE